MSKVDEIVNNSIKILQTSKSDKERKAAVKELSKFSISAEPALKELMKIVNGNEDFSIQSLAEEAVIKIGEPAIPEVKKLLNSLSRKKKSKAIGMLGEIALNNKDAIPAVLSAIKPLAFYIFNYEVRLDAIASLRKINKKYKKIPELVSLLGEILREDRNPLVYHEISEALAEADWKLALKEIVMAMNRKNYPILRMSGDARVAAGNALYLIGQDNYSKIKETIPMLLDILKNDPYPPMRITVLIPLVMAGEWEVIEEVLDQAAKDRWYQVRESALTATELLVNVKPNKAKIREIMPIIKKIAREDKFEYIQESARDLLETMDEKLKEE